MDEMNFKLPDLHGKNVILTGASDGIGVGMASKLAAAGAEVIMPVRNKSKGSAVIEEIKTKHPEAKLSLYELDLASLTSVKEFSETILKKNMPIHNLINNAGLMNPPRRNETIDGFELQFGVNYLGHVAVIGYLLPLLRESKTKVTSQVSVAAIRGKMHWDDLQFEKSYKPSAAYGQSKVALGLFALELQRKSLANGWNIVSNLSHPGVAPTNLLMAQPGIGREKSTWAGRLVGFSSKLGLTGTLESAQFPALYAAFSPISEGGKLYSPSRVGHLAGFPKEQKLFHSLNSVSEAERVWALSEKLTEIKF